jgi:hypothetical protein
MRIVAARGVVLTATGAGVHDEGGTPVGSLTAHRLMTPAERGHGDQHHIDK